MAASSEVCRLFFFSPDLRFEPLRFSTDDPHAIVIRALLGDVDAAEPRRLRCIWDASARLRRARTLLRSALAGNQPADAWEAFEAEWRWASRSRAVRNLVRTGAKDAVVNEVLEAIREELLPLLRLRAAILAEHRGEAAGAHAQLQVLGTWTLPRSRAGAFANAYGTYLRAFASAGLPLTPTITDNVTRALSQVSSDELAQAFAALVTKDARAHIAQLEHVVTYALPRMDLRNLLASAEIAIGVENINALVGVRDGVMLLARARLLDPWSLNAVKRLEEASALLASYEKDFAERRSSMTPQVQAGMMNFLEQFRGALNAAADFEQTPEGKRLKKQWNEAVIRDTARGLGWSDDPESHQRAIVVINALDEAFVDSEKPSPEAFAHARQIAQQRGVEPHDVPWDDIAETFTKDGIAFGAALSFVFRSVSTADSRVRESVVADAQPITARPANPTSIWLFSPRHWLVKAAAAAGMLMLLHVAAAWTAASVQRHRIDRQYEAFNAAAGGKDRAETIRAGADLLALLDRSDPRLREVARTYRDNVFRQIVDLSARGDTAAVKQLLAQYETVTGNQMVRSSLID